MALVALQSCEATAAVANNRIAELISENKADELPEAIADGLFYDMQTLPQALIDLVLGGRVEREVAANAAPNRHDFLVQLERAQKTRVAEEAARNLEAAVAAGDGAPPARDMPRLRFAGAESRGE